MARKSSVNQQWGQTDGGLFKRFSQKFSDPVMETLYQEYTKSITLSFHKKIAINGSIMTFGYGLYDLFYSLPQDVAQGATQQIRYLTSFTVLICMTGAGVFLGVVLYTKKPKVIFNNHVLFCAWIVYIWLWFGIVTDFVSLYDGATLFRKAFASASSPQEQQALLLRPNPYILTPNVFFILVIHALQCDFFVSLPVRTTMAWIYPLLQCIVQLLVLDQATYLTSGILMTLALYYTSICGAFIGAISNDRFRRRNFYISYRHLMKNRDTMTAYGGVLPVHQGTVLSTKSSAIVLKTRSMADKSLIDKSRKPSEETLQEIQSPLKSPTTFSTLEIAKLVAEKVIQEQNHIQTSSRSYWPIKQNDSLYFVKYLVNGVSGFINAHILMIHPNADLEQRAREKAAIRAFRVAKSSFIILIISSLVSLLYCQLSPVYATYKYETTLRHCFVIVCYLIGIFICAMGPNRVPLMKIEWILTVIFIVASVGHLSAYFITMNDRNRADALYFTTEVMAEYIVIYIAMPKVVSLRYFSLYCFIMLAYAVSSMFFSPITESSAHLLSDTFFMLPLPLILAALGEQQRRLHLSEAQRPK